MPSSAIHQYLKEAIGSERYRIQSVGGGSINQTFGIKTDDVSYFCKLNSASSFPGMFQKERNGLELIANQNIIRAPKVIGHAIIEDQQLLLLEWIPSGAKTPLFWKIFGEGLARLHHVSSEYFGLEEDNYMGSVPQRNKQEKNWAVFFEQQRLQPLIHQCISNNLLTIKHQQQFENLYQRFPKIFAPEKPSLLHGDLWNGNYMCDQNGNAVLIDPAVYFGHRSVDLGMTTLFGGFEKSFYEAYNYHFPFPTNYKEEWAICNLYPLLIHLLLFGKTYLPQIESILKSYQ